MVYWLEVCGICKEVCGSFGFSVKWQVCALRYGTFVLRYLGMKCFQVGVWAFNTHRALFYM